MFKTPLPKQVDARRAADRGLELAGQIDRAKLDRLGASLVEAEGTVEVELAFGVDEERIRYLKGTARTDVELVCQRCLEPVEVTLACELNLGMVASDEAASELPRRYDPLVVAEPSLALHAVVEDELILCLPLIALHEDCDVQTSFGDPHAQAEEAQGKPNPFSVLAKLKTKK